MCGISGILNWSGEAVDRELVHRMVSTVRHRGPDDFGVHCSHNVGLGHSRLSVIDLDSGDQPMANEDGSIWVSFNGEIFNYVELRSSLIEKGHDFSTASDTEVILHAYEEYGDACVNYFNGQWAFALWDRRRRRLMTVMQPWKINR